MKRTTQNEKFIRQPALRLFAAELAESKQTIIDHVEGREFEIRCQLTPTGVKAKRVLMMGVLVEVDNVGTSGEYLRGRIVDPTGAFNVYAGHYQPEALVSLSNLTIPCFVAVVGKTNAYRPDEETTIVSIRPETIVEIEAETRDYWVIETAAKTLERIKKSQLPEVEKEKYRQLCKDALTKLVYMPQETSIQQEETPIEPVPLQEQDIPDKIIIEQSTVKDKRPDCPVLEEIMIDASSIAPQKEVSYIDLGEGTSIETIEIPLIEGRCHEPQIGVLHPALMEEKPSPSQPASVSEMNTAHESMTPMDAPSIKEHKDEEPKEELSFTSKPSITEVLPKPESEISKTLQVKESKESKTKPSDSIKTRIKKKRIRQESANNSQKTLFTEV
nr:MAG: hypothetical protein OI716_00835 [Candidatus Methanoperedens sp.]WAI00094.1 MAG: hypothetical protein OI720_00680 [Candidatus Methanoperedens sp.]